MYDYLFICAANVGRSQMAEGFYNHYTAGVNSVSAAGLKDVRAKYHYRPHEGIIAVMKERRIDISQEKVKLVSSELVASSRKVVVFFEREKCTHNLLNYFGESEVDYRLIEDPCPGDSTNEDPQKLLQRFRLSRDAIDEVVRSLL